MGFRIGKKIGEGFRLLACFRGFLSGQGGVDDVRFQIYRQAFKRLSGFFSIGFILCWFCRRLKSRFGWLLGSRFFAIGIGGGDGSGRFAASVDFAKESFGSIEQFGGDFGARAKDGDAGDGQNESGNHGNGA